MIRIHQCWSSTQPLEVLALLAHQVSAKEVTGGQILAALRLLMHARIGGDICEENVFIQGQILSSSPLLS